MWSSSILFLSCFIVPAFTQYAGSFDCPGAWRQHADACYRFDQEEKNLEEARAACEIHSAKLLSVNSEAEHLFVEAILNEVDKKGKQWFTGGLQDYDNRNRFTWADGDGNDVEGAEFWLTTDFEGMDAEQNRIVYITNDLVKWKWFLARADKKLPFICEIPKKESYNILEQERDFGYGIAETDSAKYEIGPHFSVEPEDVLYDVADIAKITEIYCQATGNPEPEYEWWFTKQATRTKIDPLENKRLTLSNGGLIISDPKQTEDNGDYQCVAKNKFGSILSSTVQLLFAYLPDFSKSDRSPVSVSAYSGIGIECNPPEHGYPSLSFSWYKDDITNFVRPELKPYIFISNNGKLYFSSVTKDDEGEYSCLISAPNKNAVRGGGKVSMPTKLQVTAAIGKEEDPKLASGFPAVFPSSPKRGDNVRLECFAYGTDELDYSWQRVGNNLPRNAKIEDYNRVLVIPNIQLAQGGTYRCSVERREGQTATGDVEIPVESPPFFTIPLPDQHADLNSNLTWLCNGDGLPEVNYEWYLNASRLENKARDGRFIINNNKLTIAPVLQDDAGMYQCAAINTHGKKFSSAQLRVLSFPPTFEKSPLPPNQYGTLESDVTLTCEPEASPRPIITWKKDGGHVSLDDRVRLLGNGFLHIIKMSESDAGNYTCTAENIHGQAESTGQLSILGTTTLKQNPRDTTVQVNNTAFFHCEAAFNPVLDVTYDWYHNNRKLDFFRIYSDGSYKVWIEKEPYFERGTGINKGGLYIREAQYYHKGNYTCIAKTSSEIVSASAKLLVTGPPSEPAGLVGGTPTNTTIQLSWIAGRDNGKAIVSYYVEGFVEFEQFWKRITPDLGRDKIDDFDRPSVKITGLSPFSSYKFRVRAENVYGVSGPSDPTEDKKTLAAPPLTPPRNVGGGGGKVGLLTITWDPLPRNEYNGEGVGYIVHARRTANQNPDEDLVYTLPGPYHSKHVFRVGSRLNYTQYDVSVQAFNNAGAVPEAKSESVTIRSAEALPKGVPTNVRAYNYNSTALLVEWVPVEDVISVMYGKIKGYRINYWDPQQELEDTAQFNPILGQTDHGMVIGLEHATEYIINVQVYNDAGVGPKSTDFIQQTLRSPPLEAPQEVHVFPVSYDSIYVEWRGVSTDTGEEPLEGYMVRTWLQGETLKMAKDYDARKKSYLTIDDLKANIVYNLRVFGYSRGGQGLMSSPTIQFILGAKCKVKEEYPEKEYTYMCGPRENYSDTASMSSPSLTLLLLTVIVQFLRWSS